MKMTKRQIEILKGFGEDDKSIKQIERAAAVTTYEYKGRRISRKKAIELLGEKKFLSGLDRSAFHWTSCRDVVGENECVFFDSSKLFKDWQVNKMTGSGITVYDNRVIGISIDKVSELEGRPVENTYFINGYGFYDYQFASAAIVEYVIRKIKMFAPDSWEYADRLLWNMINHLFQKNMVYCQRII